MDPFISDWLNLLLRWGHLIAGIAWIGTSFYFVALDYSLRQRAGLPAGVYGEAWEVHGGGFYHVQKYMTAPASLPDHLTWFKWEAYLTWVTGFSLLIVQYYLNAETYLIDPSIRQLTSVQAVGISVASLLAGWLVYNFLCKSLVIRAPQLLMALVFVLIMAAAYGFTHVFGGRGALIHIGAFIGTLMAANVFMVIIPNQRKITAALLRGEKPDPRFGAEGKQRSLHNTYLTLPVLLLMVSNHYPMITDHPHSWLIVGLIITGGAALRHYLLRTEVGDPQEKIAWTLPVIASALALALYLTDQPKLQLYAGEVSDTDVMTIVASRCTACHATNPTDKTIKRPPKGVIFESVADLKRYASQITTQAINSKAMPLGNKTGMTVEERSKLATWLARN
jgi:uncharacterized membrane protein